MHEGTELESVNKMCILSGQFSTRENEKERTISVGTCKYKSFHERINYRVHYVFKYIYESE